MDPHTVEVANGIHVASVLGRIGLVLICVEDLKQNLHSLNMLGCKVLLHQLERSGNEVLCIPLWTSFS